VGCGGPKTPETGESGLDEQRPAFGSVLPPLHSAEEEFLRPQHDARVPGAEGHPWHHRTQRGRWAVNPLIRVSDGDPSGGANGAQVCILNELPRFEWLSNFAWCCHMVPSISPHCQNKLCLFNLRLRGGGR